MIVARLRWSGVLVFDIGRSRCIRPFRTIVSALNIQSSIGSQGIHSIRLRCITRTYHFKLTAGNRQRRNLFRCPFESGFGLIGSNKYTIRSICSSRNIERTIRNTDYTRHVMLTENRITCDFGLLG